MARSISIGLGPRCPQSTKRCCGRFRPAGPALGRVVYRCESCGTTHALGRSCGNRHCPSCQQGQTKLWLEKQVERLLPCPYFLITFTLPAELRGGSEPSTGGLFRTL